MDDEQFDELVRQALDSLPDEIAARVSNIDVEVQAWPTPDQLRSARVPSGATLLGLYQGIPLTRRNSGYQLVPPDRITIFRGPLESISRSEEEFVERVRATVIHEVAHHFGISDERLREIEAARKRRTQ